MGFQRGITIVVLGGDLANVMRAVCVIHRKSVVRLASVAKGRLAPPPSPLLLTRARAVANGELVVCWLARCVRSCRQPWYGQWNVAGACGMLGNPVYHLTRSHRARVKQQRPKGGFFCGDPARVLRHTDPATCTLEDSWRAASCDGVITWPNNVEKKMLSHNSGHHHLHRILSHSDGVPQFIVKSQVSAIRTQMSRELKDKSPLDNHFQPRKNRHLT